VRGRLLPDVFSSRGRTPLPPGLHRPRPGVRLMLLGVVVSAFAGLSLAAVGYGGAAVWLLVAGPRDAAAGCAAVALGSAVGAFLGVRVRTELVRRWIAAEDARRSPGDLFGPET